jgi:glycosyltransferase involved in cell wall biosynthesis
MKSHMGTKATPRRPRIAFVLAGAQSVRAFMTDHISGLSKTYDVSVFTNLETDALADLQSEHITLVDVAFARKISIVLDLKTLWRLFILLRNGRYDAVHSLMPKTGLLAAIAARAAFVPVRVHTFTGQVWANRKGLSRFALKFLDRLIVWLDTDILTDSPSQSQFLRDEGVCKNACVLGLGSVGGVDLDRFHPDPDDRLELRCNLGIAADDLVFGFLGRINNDKGVADLAAAFVASDLPKNSKLLLVGPDEQFVLDRIKRQFGDMDGRLILAGATREPQRFLNIFDVFCLPSYREGFGSSAIEAAACGVPAIASRIYGLTDAVDDGVTGQLHPPGDVLGITKLLQKFARDPALRIRMGSAARVRVQKQFSKAYLMEQMAEFYKSRI